MGNALNKLIVLGAIVALAVGAYFVFVRDSPLLAPVGSSDPVDQALAGQGINKTAFLTNRAIDLAPGGSTLRQESLGTLKARFAELESRETSGAKKQAYRDLVDLTALYEKKAALKEQSAFFQNPPSAAALCARLEEARALVILQEEIYFDALEIEIQTADRALSNSPAMVLVNAAGERETLEQLRAEFLLIESGCLIQ